VLPAGLLNSEDVCALVDAGPELAGVLPPPRVENIDGPEVEVVEVPAPAAVVVVAAGVAVVAAGVPPPSVGKPNAPELPPPGVFDPVFAGANMPLEASVAEAAGLSPPELRVFAELLAGWDEVPRLKVGALLAGVAEGVVLPRLPNKDVFGVACVPCVPGGAAPGNRPAPEVGAES